VFAAGHVTLDADSDEPHAHVDKALGGWQQGDCVVGNTDFVYQVLAETPVTSTASNPPNNKFEVIAAEIPGVVVISQTCDIQRKTIIRPYIEVAALIRCPENVSIDEVRKGLRPQYAYVPGVAEHALIADLDQIMTIEKPLLISYACTRGCRDDSELRVFARCVARKFSRFAFPDDFNQSVKKLVELVKGKHNSAVSDEGAAFRALTEIRVAALPHWQADKIDLFFYFIREESDEAAGKQPWSHWANLWCSRVKPGGRFRSIDGAVLPLSRIRADEIIGSDTLDLDHLST
jgi:hypothetical protein